MNDIRWKPISPAIHGFCILPFEPQEDLSDAARQISLELSDEFYAFEEYGAGWYRGYVIKQNNAAWTEETREHLDIGVFPKSHCKIRGTVPDSPAIQQDLFRASQSVISQSPEYGLKRAMHPLEEEDEEESSFPRVPDSPNNSLAPSVQSPTTPSRTRKISSSNRNSVISLQNASAYSLSGADGRRLSSASFASSHHTQNGLSSSASDRPVPPLPSLRSTDETLAGQTEPLIDEISAALREWQAMIYVHLKACKYALIEQVNGYIQILHAGRRQLLSDSLSNEETIALRKELVQVLLRGNLAQGLDVIVRHPEAGGLADVDGLGPSSMSPIRMYSLQVRSAYALTQKDSGTTHGTDLLATLPSTASNLRPSESKMSQLDKSNSAPAKPVFEHVYLDLRAFVANPCDPGELSELYFSLYSQTESKFLTEDFCVILNHNGVPTTEGRLGRMRTLFKDLSASDLQDQLFLVCRIVKNGSLKSNGQHLQALHEYNGSSTELSPRSSDREFDTGSIRSATTGGVESSMHEDSTNSMLWTSRSGRQTVRRPFGCAVLDLTNILKQDHSRREAMSPGPGPSSNAFQREEYSMPIFVPHNEATFSTLHEDIIASRTREFTSSSRAKVLTVHARALHGSLDQVIEQNQGLSLSETAVTQRLGFADVVDPDDTRNDLHIKLWSGDFPSQGLNASNTGSLRLGKGLQQLNGTSGNSKCIEITAEVRDRNGSVVENCVARGSGESNVHRYTSMVYKGNSKPTFGELFKIQIPHHAQCHVFLTFRNRQYKDRAGVSAGERSPFAFAYFPLLVETTAFLSDGSHSLALYQYNRAAESPAIYFTAPHFASSQSGQLPSHIVPLRDSLIIRTFLCSTQFTQNETLLQLFSWEQRISTPSNLLATLTSLRYSSEAEIVKHLRAVLDSLFGILAAPQNDSGDFSRPVFINLVSILGIVADRRFQNFKPVLDTYIRDHSTTSIAHSHILKSMQSLIADHNTSGEIAQNLRSALKVISPLFRIILRSREIQRTRNLGSGVTSDHLETAFKRDVDSLLAQFNDLMISKTPASVLGTQVLVLQHIAGIIPMLITIFGNQECAKRMSTFCDCISSYSGKSASRKLLLLAQIVTSPLLDSPANRATLIPNLVAWLKPHFVKYEAASMQTSVEAQNSAQINWLEIIRLANTVVAAIVDRLHESLLDPNLKAEKDLLVQEQDNAEYSLSLLPRIVDIYLELGSPTYTETILQSRSSASIVSASPAVFPVSHPFSLLSKYPQSTSDLQNNRSTFRADQGELGVVVLSLLWIVPPSVFRNFVDAAMQVEGRERFARFLSQLFRTLHSLLSGQAYPSSWLSVSSLAHSVVIKLAGPVSFLLEEEFVPRQAVSRTFDFVLWKSFFSMYLQALASGHLDVEDFYPQKRRSIWKTTGDLRASSATRLLKLWRMLGWQQQPMRQTSEIFTFGGFQVQLTPGLLDLVLDLCLTRNDSLRSTGTRMLFSMIIGEYGISSDFAKIRNAVIDKFDKMFSQRKKDSVSRAMFILQLSDLFDAASITQDLRDHVDAFITSANTFLDLLFGVSMLPDGEEFQDDRIISTLRLMSYIRDISSPSVFTKYVDRLKSYHVRANNYTEAALVLKLHADLYNFDTSNTVEAMPDANLPRQSEFSRKETLYLQTLELLGKGAAYESALVLCKELQEQYETQIFAYQRLSEILAHQSELYKKILSETRHFAQCFHVGFYGRGFPAVLQNKLYVYKANDHEKLGGFTERILNLHPNATLLAEDQPLPSDTFDSDGQYLQIFAVTPQPDRSFPIFTNPDVPQAVRAYYDMNGTNRFSYSRTFTKTEEDNIYNSIFPSEFLSSWTEKTTLTCADAFPTVLKRTEVVDREVEEFTPLEISLESIEKRTIELLALEKRYSAIKESESPKINTNPLAMALNDAVDTGSAGIPLFRNIFLNPLYRTAYPHHVELLDRLEQSIDDQVQVIHRVLYLHGRLCSPDMQSFQATLQKFFAKNFSQEVKNLQPITSPTSDSLPIPRTSIDSCATSTADADGVSDRSPQPHYMPGIQSKTNGHLSPSAEASRFSTNLVSVDETPPRLSGPTIVRSPSLDVASQSPSESQIKPKRPPSLLSSRFGSLKWKRG